MTKAFIATNWKKKIAFMPIEDSFDYTDYPIDIDSSSFSAVADGVTRDPTEYLPNLNTIKGKIQFSLKYPKPSPAKIAADIFTQAFPLVMRDYEPEHRDEKAIKSAFGEANNRIKKWNNQNTPNPDYVLNDFAGCVAAGISQYWHSISWGYLADCGIAIFDEKGNLKFRTEDQGPEKYDKYFWQDKRLEKIDWRNPEARKIIRKEYRNNPLEKHSFGVLTGEEKAMNYVRTGTQELIPNEHLIIYTDGLEPIIFSQEFSDKLKENDIKGLAKLCKHKVMTEGTLIHYKKPMPKKFEDYLREKLVMRMGLTDPLI
jgi:hypothetical protein